MNLTTLGPLMLILLAALVLAIGVALWMYIQKERTQRSVPNLVPNTIEPSPNIEIAGTRNRNPRNERSASPSLILNLSGPKTARGMPKIGADSNLRLRLA
jgi:hypothetical protein